MKHRWLVLVVLALASVQCARSIFYQNTSFISLEKYGEGTEFLPFQGRCLLVPVIRWAHSNPRLLAIAAVSNQRQHGAELQSPEKLLSTGIGVLCVLGLGLLAAAEGIRRGFRNWWLPWALVLWMLLATYGSRTTQNFWYPYDLPQFFLFGLGTFFILRGWWLPLLVLVPIASANRETTVFLPFLWLVTAWRPDAKAKALLQTLTLGALWLAVRLYIGHLYRHNASVTGNRVSGNLLALTMPANWPQILSAFGFLLPFLIFYRERLTPASRRLLFSMMVCLAVIMWYGYWIESRIFDEFLLLFAILATEAWEYRRAETFAKVTPPERQSAAS